MSHDNLRASLTPRVLEPRCNNDDLRMISEGAAGDQNEFDSKKAQKAADLLTETGNYQYTDLNRETADNKQMIHSSGAEVGQIEL